MTGYWTPETVELTIEEYLEKVRKGEFRDNLGIAYAVDMFENGATIKPSKRGNDIPEGTEYVVWEEN